MFITLFKCSLNYLLRTFPSGLLGVQSSSSRHHAKWTATASAAGWIFTRAGSLLYSSASPAQLPTHQKTQRLSWTLHLCGVRSMMKVNTSSAQGTNLQFAFHVWWWSQPYSGQSSGRMQGKMASEWSHALCVRGEHVPRTVSQSQGQGWVHDLGLGEWAMGSEGVWNLSSVLVLLPEPLAGGPFLNAQVPIWRTKYWYTDLFPQLLKNQRDRGKVLHKITCRLKSTSACDQVLFLVASVASGPGRQRPNLARHSDTLGSQWMKEENTIMMS